jgi:hypothetical protein
VRGLKNSSTVQKVELNAPLARYSIGGSETNALISLRNVIVQHQKRIQPLETNHPIRYITYFMRREAGQVEDGDDHNGNRRRLLCVVSSFFISAVRIGSQHYSFRFGNGTTQMKRYSLSSLLGGIRSSEKADISQAITTMLTITSAVNWHFEELANCIEVDDIGC